MTSSPQWLPNGGDIVFMRNDGSTDYVSVAKVDPEARSRDVDITSTTSSFGMLRVTIAPDGKTFFVHVLEDNSDWNVDVASGDAVPTDINGDDMIFIQRRAP